MAILWRVWAASAAVILAVLLVFLALATFQFSRVHSSLVGERLIVLAESTADPFQAATRLGFPIAEVRNSTGLLERARQTDDRITAIYLFDASGTIVHATLGEPGYGQSVAAVHAKMQDDEAWHGAFDAGYIAGVNIPGPAGNSAGGIAVVYPRTGSSTRVWAMAAELTVSAVGIFTLGAMLAGLFLRFGLRRTIQDFDRIEQDIAGFERDSWRGADQNSSLTGLRADLDTAYERYRASVDELKRLDGVRPK